MDTLIDISIGKENPHEYSEIVYKCTYAFFMEKKTNRFNRLVKVFMTLQSSRNSIWFFGKFWSSVSKGAFWFEYIPKVGKWKKCQSVLDHKLKEI